jgi:hypothetical protein
MPHALELRPQAKEFASLAFELMCDDYLDALGVELRKVAAVPPAMPKETD